MKYVYTGNSVTAHLHKQSKEVRVKRVVIQGDTISPKLFAATLESIFRWLNLENNGVKKDGVFLNHLGFADVTLLCTVIPE